MFCIFILLERVNQQETDKKVCPWERCLESLEYDFMCPKSTISDQQKEYFSKSARNMSCYFCNLKKKNCIVWACKCIHGAFDDGMLLLLFRQDLKALNILYFIFIIDDNLCHGDEKFQNNIWK